MATHSPIGFSFNREYARELEDDAREAVFISRDRGDAGRHCCRVIRHRDLESAFMISAALPMPNTPGGGSAPWPSTFPYLDCATGAPL